MGNPDPYRHGIRIANNSAGFILAARESLSAFQLYGKTSSNIKQSMDILSKHSQYQSIGTENRDFDCSYDYHGDLRARDGSLFSTVFDLVQRRRYRSFLSTDHSGSLDVSHLDDLEFDQD